MTDRGEQADSAWSFTQWSSQLDKQTMSSPSITLTSTTPSSPADRFPQNSALAAMTTTTTGGTTLQQRIQSAIHNITSDSEARKFTEVYPGDLDELKGMTSTAAKLSSVELPGENSTRMPEIRDFLKELSTADLGQSSEPSLASEVSMIQKNTEVELASHSQFTFPTPETTTDIAAFRPAVSRASQVSTSTDSLVTQPDGNISHTITDRLSAAVSSMFSTVTESDPELSSAPQNPVTVENLAFTNSTVVPFVLCDFPTLPSNVTDAELHRPGIYDVILEQFDVREDSSVAVLTAKAVTLGFLALMGVLGNALVIWSVVRHRHLHRPPFYYLLSLSLTDLSRAAFCLPLVLMTLLQGSVWRHGDSACDLFAFANSFFVLSSSVSLLDIAADRHLSLLYPYSYRRRSAGAVNLVVVLLGWTVAFLVSFPPVVGVGAYAFEASEGQCTLRHKFFRHDNNTLGFLLVFSVLLLATLFIYYRVFLSLRAHRKMRPLEPEPARSANWSFVGPGTGQAFLNWVNGMAGAYSGPLLARNPLRPPYTRVVGLYVVRNQHVVRLFFLMTLTFTGLWLPYQVLSYWRVFGSAEEVDAGLVTAAAWLSYGQVLVCPVVYFSSRAPTRRRTSRGDVSPDDKQQELLLESLNRQK